MKKKSREFAGGPVVRAWHFHCWALVRSLVGELRFCKPRVAQPKKKKKREYKIARAPRRVLDEAMEMRGPEAYTSSVLQESHL